MSFRLLLGLFGLGFGFFGPAASGMVILVLRTKYRITEVLSQCLSLHSIGIPCNKSSMGNSVKNLYQELLLMENSLFMENCLFFPSQ